MFPFKSHIHVHDNLMVTRICIYVIILFQVPTKYGMKNLKKCQRPGECLQNGYYNNMYPK